METSNCAAPSAPISQPPPHSGSSGGPAGRAHARSFRYARLRRPLPRGLRGSRVVPTRRSSRQLQAALPRAPLHARPLPNDGRARRDPGPAPSRCARDRRARPAAGRWAPGNGAPAAAYLGPGQRSSRAVLQTLRGHEQRTAAGGSCSARPAAAPALRQLRAEQLPPRPAPGNWRGAGAGLAGARARATGRGQRGAGTELARARTRSWQARARGAGRARVAGRG